MPVSVKINLLYASASMYIAVAEGSAQSPSVYSNLLYSTMSNGSINFTFTPTQPNVELSMKLLFNKVPLTAFSYSFTLDSVSYTQQTGANSSTQLVQISNKVGDKYRFGYNGQEKDNEIAGVGNHNTAEFWEYDTRVGRRWNTDPVVKPWESSYACFANNPIWYSDVNGDDGTQTGSGNGYMTGDLNNVVVRCSRFNADKKDDKDKGDDYKKSPGGGGGAGGAGAGANSKHSVGEDQLKKHAKQLKADGFGVEDNGGGGSGAQGGGAQSKGGVNWNGVNTGLQVADGFGVAAAAGREIALDYRMSQPLMNRVGMSTNLKTILGLGTASKYLGAAGYGTAVLGTVLDYQQMQNGQMSGARFSYNTFGTGIGIGVGIGFGAVPGAVVGGSFWGAQQMYDLSLIHI